MNDADTTKLENALRGLAESGAEPDDDAAWTAITTGIAADVRRGRRLKVLIGGAVVAGSVAAALALFAGMSNDEQSVEQGPATDPSGAATLPEHTLLAEVRVAGGATEIQVLDALSGRAISTPITLDPGQILFDAVIDREGVIYYRAGSPSFSDVVVRAMTWRGDERTVAAQALPIEAVSLAVSPDGRTLAFARGSDGTTASRIGFLDIASGDVTYLDWSREEGGDRRLTGIDDLSFSADGDELLFSASRDSLDPIESFVLQLDADETLSEARSLGQQVGGVVWGDGGVIGFRNMEIGGLSGADLVYVEEGPAEGLPPLDVERVDGVESGGGGIYVTVFSDDQAEATVLRLDASGDRWVPFAVTPGSRIIAASP